MQMTQEMQSWLLPSTFSDGRLSLSVECTRTLSSSPHFRDPSTIEFDSSINWFWCPFNGFRRKDKGYYGYISCLPRRESGQRLRYVHWTRIMPVHNQLIQHLGEALRKPQAPVMYKLVRFRTSKWDKSDRSPALRSGTLNITPTHLSEWIGGTDKHIFQWQWPIYPLWDIWHVSCYGYCCTLAYLGANLQLTIYNTLDASNPVKHYDFETYPHFPYTLLLLSLTSCLISRPRTRRNNSACSLWWRIVHDESKALLVINSLLYWLAARSLRARSERGFKINGRERRSEKKMIHTWVLPRYCNLADIQVIGT